MKVLQYLVFFAVAAVTLAALSSWLVRTRRIDPASPWGLALRRWTDPIVKPMEERLVRAGGNPVHAGWWLVVATAVAGILILGVVKWISYRVWETQEAMRIGGGRGLLALVVDWGVSLLVLAIFVRVIGSWFALTYQRWMQPIIRATDPVLNPIRRLLPPLGGLDFSPVVAIVGLWFLKELLLNILW